MTYSLPLPQTLGMRQRSESARNIGLIYTEEQGELVQLDGSPAEGMEVKPTSGIA